jgi:predicted nucleic acid-binding protein
MIVVNTTVFSNLAAADRLPLLEALFGRVLVPSQVHDEILKGIAAGYDFLETADESTEAEWIVLTTFEGQPERALFKRLLDVVGYGEAAGIAMAKERNLIFFSDDRKARRVAQDHGVEISGTLGLLKLAVEEGTLSVGEADEVLSQMIEGGYYAPVQSINELLGDDDGK